MIAHTLVHVLVIEKYTHTLVHVLVIEKYTHTLVHVLVIAHTLVHNYSEHVIVTSWQVGCIKMHPTCHDVTDLFHVVS